ncbi:hypothetical protein SAMN05421640_0546 [Ekhidna lutea]|uniref:Phasin protein n=1 Tax=Ekhidna lutea TaxID=447679 RepID=A0A239F8L2_EKHLU|nr:hypothetical protein [Ekhidna lutea]SNS53127.1 hypothetical protein SAMN05421640_0546 [Ekhidna lutea]
MEKKENNENENNPVASKISTFFKGVKENLSEGARVLATISTEVFEEAKEKAEELYEKGSDKFEQASGVVESYVEKFQGEKEIKQLSKEKEELCSILGDAVYHEFRKNGTVSKRFLTTKKSEKLILSIKEVDKRILRIGKQLDKNSL